MGHLCGHSMSLTTHCCVLLFVLHSVVISVVDARASYCDFESSCKEWTGIGQRKTNGRGFSVVTGRSQRNSHKTGSAGPLQDRTSNSSRGHYLLFRGGRLPFGDDGDGKGSTFNLTSPWFNETTASCQLRFSIQANLSSVLSLRVLLLRHAAPPTTIFTHTANYSKRWRDESVPLGRQRAPFQLQFQIRQRDLQHYGHVALDDLSLHGCTANTSEVFCSLEEFQCGDLCLHRNHVCDIIKDCANGEDEAECDTPVTSPVPLRCDFESDWCGWSNLQVGDHVDWLRHHGVSDKSGCTGPTADHTYKNTTGNYLYFDASDGKMNNRAILESVELPPHPSQILEEESIGYGSCQLRFFFHFYFKLMHKSNFVVEAIERIPCKTPSSRDCKKNDCCIDGFRRKAHKMLTSLDMRSDSFWRRQVVTIPPMRNKYTLRFRAVRGLRYCGDIALDDISISAECFVSSFSFVYSPDLRQQTTDPSSRLSSNVSSVDTTQSSLDGVGYGDNNTDGLDNMTTARNYPFMVNDTHKYDFTSCGNTGPKGPTQAQCNNSYAGTHTKVYVASEGKLAGVQVWEVPESGTYSILAHGAMGGGGLGYDKKSCGAYVLSNFNLTKGEKLYVLVGQPGGKMCSEGMTGQLEQICRNNPQRASTYYPGGGGGGGASFVFKINETNGAYVPLLIAGGGGGMPSSKSSLDDLSNSEAKLLPSGSGRNGHAAVPNKAGAGGGFFGQSASPQDGFSLAEGAVGGKPCNRSRTWFAHGGFGGGGGACHGGGGGGGYTGGNSSEFHAGYGGTSYLSPGAELHPASSCIELNGVVQIVVSKDCPCVDASYCDKDNNCVCPSGKSLAEDGIHCISPTPARVFSHQFSNMTIIAMVIGVVIILMFVGCIIFIVLQRKSLKTKKAGRLDGLSNADYQLDRLRSTVGGANVLTEYNPNYDFGGSKCTLQDLREVPRDHLTLVKALGQGAFGEVYMGYLSNVPREPCDLPVAVKTLPALCTDQAEMDFLMEALIMSKFDHPNIVRFIGVCFEKHPRFIVLELLDGGDLKSFLRESRPKPDQPSPMTMLDLLKLATDISQGCHYLEENHFIHRDIAARNCLLTKKGPGKVAKIADFGMARDIYRADYYRKGGKAMLPVKWMPPEAFLDGIFTSKTDVWSFGILLWEVFSLGYMPYPGRGNQEVMQLVTAGGRLESPQNCPQCIYNVMAMCWHGIPERRPSFTGIIQQMAMCAQDRSVIQSPLPVFHRPPSLEKESTVMRPREADQTILTIHPSCVTTPDSVSSTKPLIGYQQSPDVLPLGKQANLSGSAESLDQLLTAHHKMDDFSLDRGGFSYQRVKDDDTAYYLAPVGCLHTHCDKDRNVPAWQTGIAMDTGPVWVSAQVHKQASESDLQRAPGSSSSRPASDHMAADSGQSSIGSSSQHSLSRQSLSSQHAVLTGGGASLGPQPITSLSRTPQSSPRPTPSHRSSSTHLGNHGDASCQSEAPGSSKHEQSAYENIPLLLKGTDTLQSQSCDRPVTRPRSSGRHKDEGCDSGVVVDISCSDSLSPPASEKKDCTWL